MKEVQIATILHEKNGFPKKKFLRVGHLDWALKAWQ